MNVAIKEFV